MGLAERRARQEFETTKYPGLKKQIDEALGFELAVEVDWDSMTLEGSSHLYDECWQMIYFQPLVAAIRAIAVDDMGKQALKAGLKKVVIQNKKGTASAVHCGSFEDGVLTIDHKPTSNTHDVDPRAKTLQKLLESAL